MSTSDAHDSIVENLEHKKSSQSNDKWTYAGYKMTVFSDAEEKPNEPGFLGGYMKFYPEDALRAAGGELSVAAPNQSNVVQDRELITGQNPYSDKKLASTLLEALKN
jgi:putative intracellular protease/amidase